VSLRSRGVCQPVRPPKKSVRRLFYFVSRNLKFDKVAADAPLDHTFDSTRSTQCSSITRAATASAIAKFDSATCRRSSLVSASLCGGHHGSARDDHQAALAETHPLKRIGTTTEIVTVVLYLTIATFVGVNSRTSTVGKAMAM
jgi:hypothetical protein